MPETHEYTRHQILTILGILIVGVIALSVFFFSRESLRLDEAQSLWQTSRSVEGMLHVVAEDVHVPLYHMLLHYWQQYFGNSTSATRDLSLFFYILMIPSIYLVGRRIYTPEVGLFAAVLMAISPFMNWYGNEIRMYSLFGLLTILNQYFFLKILGDPRNRAGFVRGSVWFGYIITLLIGLYTHYFFVFVVITELFFFALYRKSFPKKTFMTLCIIGVLVAVLFAPWVYLVYHLGSASNTQPLLAKPSSIDLFNTFSEFMFGFQNDTVNTVILSLWPLLVLFIFMSLRRRERVSPETIFLFLNVIIPIGLAFAASILWKPIYLSRYLVLSLPALYLLVSWLISTYSPRVGRLTRVALVIGMLITLGIEIASAATPVREDYHDASTYLESHATPSDIIVLSAPFTIYPFEYYYSGPTSVETLPLWNQYVVGPIPKYSPEELTTDVDALKGDHITLWLLLSYDQGYENSIKLYFDTHYERVDERTFSPGLDLYAYKLRYDDTSFQSALKHIREGGAHGGSGSASSSPA